MKSYKTFNNECESVDVKIDSPLTSSTSSLQSHFTRRQRCYIYIPHRNIFQDRKVEIAESDPMLCHASGENSLYAWLIHILKNCIIIALIQHFFAGASSCCIVETFWLLFISLQKELLNNERMEKAFAVQFFFNFLCFSCCVMRESGNFLNISARNCLWNIMNSILWDRLVIYDAC